MKRTISLVMIVAFVITGLFCAEMLYPVIVGGKLSFIDKTGKVVLKTQLNTESFTMFSDGYAPYVSMVNKVKHYGLMDASGKVVIEPIYDAMSFPTEGKCSVMKNGKWGYIDTTGKKLTEFIYDQAWPFEGGRALVMLGDFDTGKYGMIDLKGNYVLKPEYAVITEFSEGFVKVSAEWGKCGFADTTGEIVIAMVYSDVMKFTEGLAAVKVTESDDGWAYINTKGELAIDMQFAEAYPFSDGLAAVGKKIENAVNVEAGLKFGFIDKTGKVVIPYRYDYVALFCDGLALVRNGDLYGYINKKGEEVIKIQYADAKNFQNGVAVVKVNEKFGAINKKGEFIIKPEYDFVETTGDIIMLGSGNSSENAVIGYADMTGKIIYKPSR